MRSLPCLCILLVTCLLDLSVRADNPRPTVRLAEGKFGKALDAAVTPLAFGGDQRYRTPPLTVECWTQLQSKRGFNVLVSSDPKSSAQHWELYSYARSGALAAYLPGYEPSEVVSKKNICDRKWHHVAMTFDGKQVRLFVDGKAVHEQAVKPRPGGKAVPGPLSVGQAIDGSQRIGCDGLIDEVRISRILRRIDRLPTAAPAVDPQTVGLWRFDDSDTILADPAWTPPPVVKGEAWERATDVDWVDARLRQMDTGLTFNATLAYQHAGKRLLVYKGTAIRIGAKGEGAVIFDRNQLRLAAGWTGGYLHHSDRRFGLLNTPTPQGVMTFSTPSVPGWQDPRRPVPDKTPPPATAPLPHAWGRFTGMYLHGQRVVLSYTMGTTEVRESPWLEQVAGQKLISRTIEVGPSRNALHLLVGDLPGKPVIHLANHHTSVVATMGDQVALVHVVAPFADKGRLWTRPGVGTFYLLAPSDRPRRIEVLSWSGNAKDHAALAPQLARRSAPESLDAWTKAGPSRWKPLFTRGEVGKDTGPYTIDTLTIPYDNPYRALFFCTAHDFLPDGRIALCTCHGDVWVVSGVDVRLDRLTWQRFATGLYHPLGLRVVDGKIVVLERGQLTRLHDLNGDGEADRYENLCHDWHTGSGEHSYDTCLERDAAGNYYFFKTGDTNLPHGGCLLRVSKDGKTVEVFATGFRHPIGMGLSPDGEVTGADQEGNWMPATRIDVYKKGGFYGDMRAHHRATPPRLYDPPLLWLPREADNSAGGQVWVPHDRFGLPTGQMLHLSYGRCKLYAVLPQTVGSVRQAGAVDLGLFFLSGVKAGRFSPKDGHLYLTGLNGWQTAAQRDGCLQRVRYTGKPLHIPTGWAVHAGAIHLTFPHPVDTRLAREKANYRIEQWNYRWSADYGSNRWSVRRPNSVGQDHLTIDAVEVSADGKKVILRVKDLVPAMQMRIGYTLRWAEGSKFDGALYSTVHELGR